MGFLASFRGLPRAAWLLIGAGSGFWVLVGLYSVSPPIGAGRRGGGGGVLWALVGLYRVSLPIYLKRAGYDELFIGFVLTLTGLVAVLLVVPFGLLADPFGRRRLMMIGAGANVGGGAVRG